MSLPESTELPQSLRKKIEDIATELGYIEYNIEHTPISSDGGSFLAKLYVIDIKGKKVNGEHETNLFAKYAVAANQSVISVTDAYLNETYAYTELFGIYDELQEEAKIPVEERFIVLKSYKCDSQTIILENISKQGFKSPHRTDVMSWDFIKQSTEQLARFHALSFVLKNKKPQYYQEKITTKPQTLQIDIICQYLKNSVIESTRNIDPAVRDKVLENMSVYEETFQKSMTSNDDVTCCLCHGDYRPNNIMKKEKDGVVQEIRVMDFQTLYYGCPAIDLLYLIYLGTDHIFRKKHFKNVIKLYHDSMRTFLKYFQVDVESVYPKQEFLKVLEERMDYGLTITLAFMPSYYVDDDKVPDLDKVDIMTIGGEEINDERATKRIEGVLNEFIELGLIKI